jgi:hypothetical protein
MIGKVASGVLTLITAAIVSGVFMLPLLLIMEWIGLYFSGWWVFLIVFVIVLIELGPLTRDEDRVMWA